MLILSSGTQFLEYSLLAAIFIMSFSLLFPLLRVFHGPTLPDRIIALDQIAGIIAAIMLCDVLYSGNIILFDVVLILSFIFVFGAMIIARYLFKKLKENE